MKILITKAVGAFLNSDGQLVNPNPGEEVEVSKRIGEALISLESADEVGESTTSVKPGDSPVPDATPDARQEAGEAGLDLREIPGTGSGGRITVGDVRKAAKKRESPGPSETPSGEGPSETRA